MKVSRFLRSVLPLGLVLLSGAVYAAAPSPVDSVDPFVGTDGHGHTYPGATMPFGMVQLSPDTRTETWDGCSGYHFSDPTIMGFSHTHLAGTGVGCLGDVMLMPTVGDVHLDAGHPGSGYVSRFSHEREEAHPGYYRVYLQDPGVTAELTATERTGFHRYTFPAADRAHIVIDLDHGIQNSTADTQLTVENATTFSGYRKSNGWGGSRTLYYVMQFSRPFDSYGIEKSGHRLPGGTAGASGGKIKAFVTYKTKAGEAILVKVGISATGVEGARKNLNAENPGWDFDAVRSAAAKAWNRSLGAAQVETADPHIRRTFYTNMYLAYLAPNLYNDVDGSYRGLDHRVHTGANFQNYSTFSLWDTYRAEHPLLTILQPDRVKDLTQSLLTEYRESGLHSTPIWPLADNETWCMIGYHSVPVIVDAYFKGLYSFDPETAYHAIRDTAMQDHSGLADYKKLGYVGSRRGEQAASKTMEYAFDDWCIARMARALGHKDDADLFFRRAANYRNLYDETTGLIRGRRDNGSWRVPFDPQGMVGDEYTEADAWQYTFSVQQDVPGLIALCGGDAGFVKKLDTLFTMDSTIHTNIPDITGLIGQYSQGDEQCHHVAYLYNYAGQPYKSQQRLRQVMATFYNDTPAGQCGNDDCGQMAAWYVQSALGFYPVNPASGIYVLGSPVVDKAVIRLDPKFGRDKTFTVVAEHNGPRNVYIQSATLNGKPLTRTWFTHEQLTQGGTLKLVMGPQPNVKWGASADSRPPATMPAGVKQVSLIEPFFQKPATLNLPIRIAAGSDDPVEGFVAYPDSIGASANGSNVAIDTSAPNAAPAAIYQNERYATNLIYSLPVPRDKTYTVRLHFAEIFDSGVGERIEDVAINNQPVLTNFDILAAAGAMNKAVVKEFNGVRPGDDGNIRIRIAASKDSPDQNAKINGIEVLPQ